jgi:putative Mg2+ transporter-C (MgtC) family protein
VDIAAHLRAAADEIGALVTAFVLALPMAWDRERRDQSLGLRTFPLISLAACAFVLVAQATLHDEHAVARVMEGVIAGVGFLGGGAIVKQGANVRGAATAAAVWTTAALGLSVARGEFAIAIALAVIGFATLRWLRPRRLLGRSQALSERAENQGAGALRAASSRDSSASPSGAKDSGERVANSGR